MTFIVRKISHVIVAIYFSSKYYLNYEFPAAIKDF